MTYVDVAMLWIGCRHKNVALLRLCVCYCTAPILYCMCIAVWFILFRKTFSPLLSLSRRIPWQVPYLMEPKE